VVKREGVGDGGYSDGKNGKARYGEFPSKKRREGGKVELQEPP